MDWKEEEKREHPYDKEYVYYVMREFGYMLDYAIRNAKHSPEDFIAAFLKTRIPKCVELGDPEYVAGTDGVEMYEEVAATVFNVDVIKRRQKESSEYIVGFMDDYWVGSMLAWYQWHSNMSFEKILKIVPIADFYYYFPTYHQMDEFRFLEDMDKRILGKNND